MLDSEKRDRLFHLIAAGQLSEADQILSDIRGDERARALPQARGYNMSLLEGYMSNSRGSLIEFDNACVEQMLCMYDYPAVDGSGAAGTFCFESTGAFLDAPTPPVILPGATAAAQLIRFNSFGAGMVLGIIGSVIDVTTGLGITPEAVNLQLQLNAKDNLNTDGQNPTFTNYGSILRNNTPYFPFRRLVSSLDTLHVTFQSNIAGGGNNVTPHFTLCFAALAMRRS